MDCIALARGMPAWDAGDHDAVALVCIEIRSRFPPG
jgi:hypothetical protein